MTQLYGLIGEGIQYSRSPDIWRRIWQREGASHCSFELLDTPAPLAYLDRIRANPGWKGLMVTTPYKELLLPHLDHLSTIAREVGAVNAVKVANGKLLGYNTDVLGFIATIEPLKLSGTAIILGSGGASKAVAYALKLLGIPTTIVSRTPTEDLISYAQITSQLLSTTQLITNATPLGGPKAPRQAPPIPYHLLKPHHILYDLSYQPSPTGFLKAGPDCCKKIDGERMLLLQAEEAWQIFSGQE